VTYTGPISMQIPTYRQHYFRDLLSRVVAQIAQIMVSAGENLFMLFSRV